MFLKNFGLDSKKNWENTFITPQLHGYYPPFFVRVNNVRSDESDLFRASNFISHVWCHRHVTEIKIVRYLQMRSVPVLAKLIHNLPPTVENCPNESSEATLMPLSRVVTCVA